MKRFLLVAILIGGVLVPTSAFSQDPAPPAEAVTETAQPAAPAPAEAVKPAPEPSKEAVAALEDGQVTPEEVPGTIAILVKAIKDKNWKVLVSTILMLIIFFANTFLLKFLSADAKKNAIPWITVGTATLLLFAGTLAAGGSWWDALNDGFITGAAASGLWSLVGKHVLKRFTAKAEEKPKPAEG